MGYFHLSKKFTANKFVDHVKKNGKATVQVMDEFDRDYYKLWESVVIYNGCEIESVHPSSKPWVYITFKLSA